MRPGPSGRDSISHKRRGSTSRSGMRERGGDRDVGDTHIGARGSPSSTPPLVAIGTGGGGDWNFSRANLRLALAARKCGGESTISVPSIFSTFAARAGCATTTNPRVEMTSKRLPSRGSWARFGESAWWKCINGDSRMDSEWHRLRQVILLEVSSIVAAVVRRQKKEALCLYFLVTVRWRSVLLRKCGPKALVLPRRSSKHFAKRRMFDLAG